MYIYFPFFILFIYWFNFCGGGFSDDDVIEPELSESNSSNNHREVVSDDENNGTLELDGGFLVPNSNAFGHSFRSALVLKNK